MSNWEDFKKKGHLEDTEHVSRPSGKFIEGNFICQDCHAYVDDGTYYQIDSILKYVCENGHTNFVEGFRLA